MIQQRKRKGNNLAQSLGRMAHVKSKTVTWLKGFDKQIVRDAPFSIFLPSVPSPSHLFCSATTSQATPTVSSPMLEWPSDRCCLPLHVTCSFCSGPTRGDNACEVTYNYMLPRPFVLTCAACLKNHGHE